jgi:hypothetical protein
MALMLVSSNHYSEALMMVTTLERQLVENGVDCSALLGACRQRISCTNHTCAICVCSFIEQYLRVLDKSDDEHNALVARIDALNAELHAQSKRAGKSSSLNSTTGKDETELAKAKVAALLIEIGVASTEIATLLID